MARIEVTQHHIREAQHGSCWTCPVSNGVRDVCNDRIGDVSANPHCISLWNREHPPRIIHDMDTPEAAVELMRAFDANALVCPITFDLDIPEQFLK